MPRILHILTRPDNSLAERVIREQSGFAEINLMVTDLTSAPPDYDRLLEELFEADSVQVW